MSCSIIIVNRMVWNQNQFKCKQYLNTTQPGPQDTQWTFVEESTWWLVFTQVPHLCEMSKSPNLVQTSLGVARAHPTTCTRRGPSHRVLLSSYVHVQPCALSITCKRATVWGWSKGQSLVGEQKQAQGAFLVLVLVPEHGCSWVEPIDLACARVRPLLPPNRRSLYLPPWVLGSARGVNPILRDQI